MMQPLYTALGGLARIPQFFVWRLEWNAADGKYNKQPYDPKTGRAMAKENAQDNPAQWMTYEAAAATVAQLNGWGAGQYALGFWLTADTGYWFIDIDKSVNTDGSVSSLANDLLARFPGACGEYSSSGKGLHIFGKGEAPQHTTKNTRLGLEFYTDKRGIAFGLSGMAWGNADTTHAESVAHVVGVYFRASTVSGEACMTGPRADWSGPTDDNALLQLAFSRKSAAAAFGTKAGLDALMRGDRSELFPFFNDGHSLLESEADMALCAHLAYWTGCDVPRMERIARMSGLKRDKWDEQRPLPDGTYVSWIGFTCFNAAQTTPNVLQQVSRAAKVAAQVALPVTAESVAANSDWIVRVQRALEDELRNEVVPAIAADTSIGELDRERLASLVKDRFKVFGFPMTIAKARALIAPPRVAPMDSGAPEWAHQHVYVLGVDKFYNLRNGALLSRTAFGAEYDRLMPLRETGKREDAAEWCLTRWGTATVHAQLYWPGKPAIFEHEGLSYANLCTDNSVPQVAAGYTAAGTAGIEAFRRHLWILCGQRQAVYEGLLSWLAHNAQNPGRKIRFAPLIKGIEGDGKTIIGTFLSAAMGGPHVKVINNEAFTDRFTDWGHGAAVGVVEEIMMTGKERYMIANKIKPFITNDRVAIRPFGGATFNAPNTMNYMALTNFNDAVALSDSDRRWWIIFSPFSHKSEFETAHGGYAALRATLNAIYHAIAHCPGELRRWLLEYPIPATFDPDGHAPETEEKGRMRASGTDDVDMLCASIIEDGAYGIGVGLLSSNELGRQLRTRAQLEGMDIPRTTAINHLLSRMGWSQYPKQVKWDGRAHRVWMKGATYSSQDAMRAQLDMTKGAMR